MTRLQTLYLALALAWGAPPAAAAEPSPSGGDDDDSAGDVDSGGDDDDSSGDDDDSSGDDDDSSGDDDDSSGDEHPPLRPPFALPPEFPPLAYFLAEAQDDAASAPAPERADFSILYEGATHGISGAGPDLWADQPIQKALGATDGGWALTHSGFGAALKDDEWLLQRDGAVRGFKERMQAGLGEVQAPAQAVTALLSDDTLIVVWPPEEQEALLPILEEALAKAPLRVLPMRHRLRGQVLRGESGSPILRLRSNGEPRSSNGPMDPLDWEIRLQSVYQSASSKAVVHVVARLEGEGARRAALAAKWRRSPSLYLSAGEAVEGRSFLSSGGLSLTRPITWEAWTFLGLSALAPGRAELIGGVENLRKEAEAAGTALVSANLVDEEGKPLFESVTVEEVAGRRVALIGWTDPSVVGRLPPEARKGLGLRGVEAIYEVLGTLAQSEEGPPDLTVVFGVGARSISGALPGVDIVLGDFTTELGVPRWEEIDEAALRVRATEPLRARAPALVARSGKAYLGRIDLAFDPEGGTLRRLRHLRARLGEELPASIRWTRRVQGVRQTVYASLEEILVPDLRGMDLPRGATAPPSMTVQALARLAGNLLLDRTGADVSLLRPLPRPISTAGASRELSIDASLSVADEVVVVEMSGAQLKHLLERLRPYTPDPASPEAHPPGSHGSWAWAAGLTKNGRKVTFRGRLLSDDERIRIATTTFFADDPQLAGLLKRAIRWNHFTGGGWQRLPTPHKKLGATWSLHDLVKQGLSELRHRDPNFGASYARGIGPLLRDVGKHVGPRFVLELDGISLQVTGSVPVGNREGYESSRESRVQQEESFSTSLRGRIAATFEDWVGSVHGSTQWAFGRSQVADVEEPTELEDDFQLGLEGRLNVVRVPMFGAKVPLSAFVQSVFDTEFTPGKDETGAELPIQRVLRTTTGVNLSKLLIFKVIKAGFFVEYDLSAEVGPVSPGISLGATTEKRWGPVRWANLIDFKGYLPTEADTEEDLAGTLNLRSDLSIVPLKKLIPGLSVGGFIDAMIFAGKSDNNTHPGLHLLLGAAMTYDTDLRPPLRLR